MKTVFLHIGTHKTGSTSLQFFLDRAAPALRKQGVLYPRAGRSERLWFAHHPLAWVVLKTEETPAEDVWGDVKAEIAGWAGEKVVLSCEDFSLCNDAQTTEVVGPLEGFRVEVVVYVRKPIDYALSAYKQHLASNGHRSLEEHLRDFAERCDYLSLVRRWEACAGVDAVRVRLYDKVRRSAGVEADFAEMIGVDFEPLAPFVGAPVNVSHADDVLQTIRAVNRTARNVEKYAKSRRIVAGIARRMRRAVYKKHYAGRVLVAAMRPWFASDALRWEVDARVWRRWRDGVRERHRAFLEAYVDPEDRRYLKL
ncbi:hypothetical protein [Rhodocaloribacter sp.]